MLRYASCKRKFGDGLCMQVLDYLDYSAVIYPCGMYFGRIAFEDDDTKQFERDWFYITCIIIGCLYIIIPMREILLGFISNSKLGKRGKWKTYADKFRIESYEVSNPGNWRKYREMTDFRDSRTFS